MFEKAPHHLGLVAGLSRVVTLKGHAVQLVVQPQGVDNFRGARQKRTNPHGHFPPLFPALGLYSEAQSVGPRAYNALYDTRLCIQWLEHGFPAAYPIRPWWLNVQVCDLAVDNEHGITFGAHPETTLTKVLLQAKSPRELAEPIRKHPDLPGRIALTPPRCQDHSIIHRHTHDLINPLGLDGVGVLYKAREMLFRAGAREGTGDCKEHDTFAGEEFRGWGRVRCPAFIKDKEP